MSDMAECWLSQCEGRPVVQWRRRPTGEELCALIEAEEERRRQLLERAVSQGRPVPGFGPLPGVGDVTVAVLSCAEHAIHIDLGSRVHGPDCSGLSPSHLPGCACEPEAPAQQEPAFSGGGLVELGTGWRVPAAAMPNEASPS